MKDSYLYPFRHLAIPAASFALVILISLRYPNAWANYESVMVTTPYFVLGASAAIALYLMQYGYFYTAVLFGFAFMSIRLHLQTPLDDPSAYFSFTLMSVLLPLITLFIVILGRTLSAKRAFVLLSVMSSLVWLPMVIGDDLAATIISRFPNALVQPWFSFGSSGVLQLASAVPVTMFLVMIYLTNPTMLSAFWLVANIAFSIMLMLFSFSLISTVVFSVLSLLLIIALLREAFLLAYVDELTDIPGRKAMEKQLQGLGKRYAIAMLDVDHFKKFNDTYGHDVGDQVLRMVAAKINEVGGGGKAYRYGGEEFTVIFSGSKKHDVAEHLDVVRQNIENYRLQLREPKKRPANDKHGRAQRSKSQGRSVQVTISIGIADSPVKKVNPIETIKKADKALYSAKKAGRNCVAIAR